MRMTSQGAPGGSTMTGPSARLAPPLIPRRNFMRQAGFEPTTFGSGGRSRRRPATPANAVGRSWRWLALVSNAPVAAEIAAIFQSGEKDLSHRPPGPEAATECPDVRRNV